MYSYQQQEVYRESITKKSQKESTNILLLVSTTRGLSRMKRQKSTNIVLLQLISTTRGFIRNQSSQNHNEKWQTYYYLYQQQEVLSKINHQKIAKKINKHNPTPTLINNKRFYQQWNVKKNTIKINKHTTTLINNKRFYHESIIKKLTKRSTNIVLLQLLSTRRGFIKNETSKKHNKNQQTW